MGEWTKEDIEASKRRAGPAPRPEPDLSQLPPLFTRQRTLLIYAATVLLAVVTAVWLFGCLAEQPRSSVDPAKVSMTKSETHQEPKVTDRVIKAPDGTITQEKETAGVQTKVERKAESKGAGATVQGDKLSEEFKGTAPGISFGEAGGDQVTGGDVERKAKAEADQTRMMVWGFTTAAVIAGLAGVGCFLAKQQRAALVCLGTCGVFVCCALWPIVALWISLGLNALLMFGAVWIDKAAKFWHESTRAHEQVVSELPAEQKHAHRARYEQLGDAQDVQASLKVRAKDKYAT